MHIHIILKNNNSARLSFGHEFPRRRLQTIAWTRDRRDEAQKERGGSNEDTEDSSPFALSLDAASISAPWHDERADKFLTWN